MRTSQSHPIQIGSVPSPDGRGAVGLTFCPGKKQPTAMTGSWDRDLDIDLDAIRSEGFDAVVTLIEAFEMEDLQVTGLGDGAGSRGMTWFHLPIVDQMTPCDRFEQEWAEASPELHGILDRGGKVLVHCKGGQGRAGTIACRLLIERGGDPDAMLDLVRAARRGAVENDLQERHVRSLDVSQPV